MPSCIRRTNRLPFLAAPWLCFHRTFSTITKNQIFSNTDSQRRKDLQRCNVGDRHCYEYLVTGTVNLQSTKADHQDQTDLDRFEK